MSDRISAQPVTVCDLCDFMDAFAPQHLAEEWDNVGLLLGDRGRTAERVMTCLTVTPESVEEAVAEKVDAIVAHHPLPFRALKRITTDTYSGRLIVNLLESHISLISPHTGFDSAEQGINQLLAAGIGLQSVQPLVVPAESSSGLGAGRWGQYQEPIRLHSVAKHLQTFLRIDGLQCVGPADSMISKVAVGCGSAGEFLSDAQRVGCDLLVIGETNFHTCLEANACGICLLLPGHYASERFAVEHLADTLQRQFPQLKVWPSQRESDPIRWDRFD